MTQSLPLIGTRVPIKGNPYAGCDPEIDALYEAANKASTVEEQNRLAKEANMRLVELHWVVVGPVTPQFNVAQPLAELMTPPIRRESCLQRRAPGAALGSVFPAPICDEEMRAYIIRRVLLLIPTFLLLSILVFLSVRFLPGDAPPVDALISDMQYVPE